jgi:hypothetical protein
MKNFIIPVVLILLSIFLITACGPESPGVNSSVTFSIRTVSNGNPIGGVTLTYGETAVQTGSNGTLSLTIDPADYPDAALPETINITASKKFFVSSSATYTLSEYAASSTITEDLEIAPRIFIPDMMGNTGIGRIVAIDDMSGTNRVELSEIPGYIDSAAEEDETSEKMGRLDAPTAITVDYDNGIIYIFDVESWGGTAWEDDIAVLIRLTDFPSTAADTLAPADVKFFMLGGGDATFTTVHQAVITGADEVLAIIGDGSWDDSNIFRLSGMAADSILVEEAAYSDSTTRMASGLAVLPDSKILYLRTSGANDEEFKTLDNFPDTSSESFFSYNLPSIGDPNYFEMAMRLLVDKTGSWLYTGDLYDDNQNEDPEYDRVARFDLSSTTDNKDRLNYGGPGPGTAEFDDPIPLAVLPDNRLYIIDASNNRLVRLDWTGDGAPTGWSAYTPTGDDAFGFDYFSFYSAC